MGYGSLMGYGSPGRTMTHGIGQLDKRRKRSPEIRFREDILTLNRGMDMDKWRR